VLLQVSIKVINILTAGKAHYFTTAMALHNLVGPEGFAPSPASLEAMYAICYTTGPFYKLFKTGTKSSNCLSVLATQ
jgi:hypothetical protein